MWVPGAVSPGRKKRRTVKVCPKENAMRLIEQQSVVGQKVGLPVVSGVRIPVVEDERVNEFEEFWDRRIGEETGEERFMFGGF
jgi:hypothetical protein